MKKSFIFLLFSMLSFSVFAQFDAKDAVKWTNSVSKTKNLSIGDEVTMTFSAKISPEFHLYSSKTSAGKPAKLIVDVIKGAKIIGGFMESGKQHKGFDEIFEAEEIYYNGTVTFSQRMKITGEKIHIEGALEYQICNENSCIFPVNDFSFDLKASKKADDSEETTDNTEDSKEDIIKSSTNINDDIDKSDDSETKEKIEKTADENDVKDMNMFLLFLKAFLFGFTALVTPCVFPMIPMTVSFFLKQSKGDKKSGIRKATFYGISIIVIYVVIGLLVTAIFGAGALNDLSANPWMNLIFFVLLVVFGLSFLGWFEITLPSSWVNKVDNMSDRGGMIGIFFMALTLALVSFSCTGPIVGFILVDAASGSIIGPAVGMFGFALALALPFTLFAIFPNMMKGLPKSGGWLNVVKVVLGFIEIAFAFKFLSITDMAWNWEVLDKQLFLQIWIVLSFLLGLYLLGKIRLPHDSPVEKIKVPRLMFSSVIFTFMLYLIPGLWGENLTLITGYLPSYSNSSAHFGSGGHDSGGNESGVCDITDRKYADELGKYTAEGFCSFYDIDEAIAHSKKVNKPIFVDFTGISCANCRDMEHKVWVKPKVKEILNKEYVMVSLFVDHQKKLPEIEKLEDGTKLRTVGDKWKHLQESKYGTQAQPYYVLVDAEMTMLTKPRAYDTDVDEYVSFLKEGVKKYKELHP